MGGMLAGRLSSDRVVVGAIDGVDT